MEMSTEKVFDNTYRSLNVLLQRCEQHGTPHQTIRQYTSITAFLQYIRMTTERTKLVHQFVFIKVSFVKKYYLFKILPLNPNEQL